MPKNTKDLEPTQPTTQTYRDKRNELLKGLTPETIRKAWFTASHLLLPDDAKVIDMGCDDGAMTYAMAAMYPKLDFTGLDKSKRQISKAKEQYKLPNLTFKVGDASSEIFEAGTIDAILNSYILHEVYSGSRYNERIVSDTLRKHFKMLKKGGIMFIRDFARPPPEEFVLIEMPDETGTGKALSKMSEPELLLWYAEHARPRQDPGCGGFFLEELPERIPRTRLFRLPYKWAYEFIMRKDDRKSWDAELPMEYTFFTQREFRKELGALGARMQYSGPHWDDDIINDKFEGKFRLYANDGTPLGHPPTCFITVATKLAERKSLNIEERRPSSADSGNLKITAMRNQKTGEITDIVTRDLDVNEIIPYRVDEEGRLKLYLHDGIARSIANAVPRGGINIDGRRWSGHMIEAIAVDGEAMSTMEEFDAKHSALFARDYLGLKPANSAIMEHGPDYYPAPDYIDEIIKTFYLNVNEKKGEITPKSNLGHSDKFQAKGVVREMDAQAILNAITIGMIPNARLELQILSLFDHLNLKAETWSDKRLNLEKSKINDKLNVKDILSQMSEEDKRFKDIKGNAGQLRAVHSVFVEEGASRGAMSGLTSQDVDFVVNNDKTINTVVVLPITKDLKGEVHAGVDIKYLPIPQRHTGNGLSISAPSFELPPEITNQKEIKRFIADKFKISPAMVLKMGESYYSHVGMTPQRIHPYAIAAPAKAMKYATTKFIPFYQMALLQKSLSKEPHFMTAIARAYRYFNDDIKFNAKLEAKQIVKQRFEGVKPDWGIPLSYETVEVAKRKDVKPFGPSKEDLAKIEAVNKAEQKTAPKAEKKALPKLSGAPKPTADNKINIDAVIDIKAPNAPSVEPDLHPEHAPDLSENFDAEFEAFLDLLEENNFDEDGPRPEKW
ncbi:MAG: class I SAM-dependent methyltransferase [Alphaproteobacteria bacterium]